MPGNNVKALWQKQAQVVTGGLGFLQARNRFKSEGCGNKGEGERQGRHYTSPNTYHGSLIRPKKGEYTVRVFVGGRDFGQMKMAQDQHLSTINKIYLHDKNYNDVHDLDKKLKGYKQLFMEFDLDNSGDIDFYELKMMMEKLGQPKTHLELKKMLVQVDKSGSGTISYREFIDMMLGPRSATFKYVMQFEDMGRDKKSFLRGPPPKRSLKDLP